MMNTVEIRWANGRMIVDKDEFFISLNRPKQIRVFELIRKDEHWTTEKKNELAEWFFEQSQSYGRLGESYKEYAHDLQNKLTAMKAARISVKSPMYEEMVRVQQELSKMKADEKKVHATARKYLRIHDLFVSMT